MSDATTHLLLPYLLAGQAQKHVTHNEALRLLDAVVQLAVLDRTRATPPTSPADGDRHIVASGASGAWAGWDRSIACWVDGAWVRLVPRTGWLAWVADEDLLLVYDGAEWVAVGGGTPGELQNLALLGLRTTADAANPFAARLNAALWTARTVAEGGSGDLRMVVNKEADADTASLLFQTGFSGRAEFGLLGSDAFSLKVSPDGSAWTTALAADLGGTVTIGHASAVPLFGANTPSLQSHGNVPLGLARWSNNASGPVLTVSKSRSSTIGSIGSPVQNGDGLGAWSFCGDNGSLFDQAVTFIVSAAGDWSSAPGRSADLQVRTRSADTIAVRLYLRADGALQLPSIATTANAANAFLDGGNQNNLLRSTSSLRYKREVEDLEPGRADRVLGLRPIWYRSAARADDPDWSWYGLGAEEVAEVDPRLVHWAYPDEAYDLVLEVEPDTGTEVAHRVLKPDARKVPDGVQYDRVAVLLLDVVKRQDARITALEARIVAAEVGVPSS